MIIEGVDYSSTGNDDWAGLTAALKAEGKHFAGRYAVNDKAPDGRGIGPAQYAALVAGGLDTFLYWEQSEGWMLNGWTAGVSAAHNAQQNIIAARMPVNMPVYFAADFDFAPEDQVQLDDCLRGAASVLGPERVGVYGGFYVVRRCSENGSAKWFAQTSAWSQNLRRQVQWFHGNHLEQYAYNKIIFGTNCDLVRAVQPHYGQASDFLTVPIPDPTPAPVPLPKAEPFPGFKHGLKNETDVRHDHITYQYVRRIMIVRKGRQAPGYNVHGQKVVTHTEHDHIQSAFIADIEGKQYLWDRDGIRYARSPFSPKLTLQPLT